MGISRTTFVWIHIIFEYVSISVFCGERKKEINQALFCLSKRIILRPFVIFPVYTRSDFHQPEFFSQYFKCVSHRNLLSCWCKG